MISSPSVYASNEEAAKSTSAKFILGKFFGQ